MSAPPARKPIIIVQGGQWGSEAKGLITQKLCTERRVDLCIRTGTVNAGHTAYYKGKPYKMQQLPVGWTRPETTLVIGAGAFIHPDILAREIDMVNEATGADIRSRLWVDIRCGLHLPFHTHLATDADRHHKMGATGKGCSEAVVEKIRGRGDGLPHTFIEWASSTPHYKDWKWLEFIDTVELLNRHYDHGAQLLIEGTQGTLLDLHLGPYPYVTHKQTQAANWMAECGLSVTLPVDLVSVMRTFPIRVAGNSGPMPGEMAWAALAHEMNEKMYKSGHLPVIQPHALHVWMTTLAATTKVMLAKEGAPPMPYDPALWTDAEKKRYAWVASEAHATAWLALDPPDQDMLSKLFERTTVTNKLRRIARWDAKTAADSIRLNRPTSVALTFLNYVFPEAYGATRTTFGNLSEYTRREILSYVANKELELGCPISIVGFGPLEEHTFSFYPGEFNDTWGVSK